MLKRDFILSNVLKALAAAVLGPLYAASAHSLWGVVIGMAAAVVGVFGVIDELFGFRVLRRLFRRKNSTPRRKSHDK